MSQAHYSSSELRAIYDRNPSRLPPASAVYGMAMYELKRDAEHERLFHHAMFDISQLKQTSAAQAARTSSLERAMKACASHHDNERPVSLAGVQSIQHALDAFSPSDTDPKSVVKRANWLLNELVQEAISTEDQVALTTILTTNLTHQAKMDLQKAILHLRDDHMKVTNELLEAKIRISKLEDIVRALTAQRNVAQDSLKMAQEIEATTRYGKTVVLKIPKGQALVPFMLRPSRSLTPTPPNHRADRAPDSQVPEDNATIDGANQPTSSQSTSEVATQPEDSKASTLEKPLPPIPVAAAFPACSYIKQEPLGNGWESGNVQPVSAALRDNIHTTASLWGASTLKAIPPVQIAPDTPRAGEEPAPIPRSKGKGKKKWTDPPIFKDSQPIVGGNHTEDVKENTKTLFSYDDGAEPSTTGHDPAVRSDARVQNVAHPEIVSPIRDVTNQSTASQPRESNTLAHQPGPPRTETSNNKRLFKELLRNNNADHGHRLPPQSTATQASAQPTPTSAPASGRTEVCSCPGDMRRMMQSITPRANYVASPEATTASREKAVPRAPVNITATTSQAAASSEEKAVSDAGVIYKITHRPSGRTDNSILSYLDGSSAKPGRIAKRSAVKKVTEGSSIEQVVPAQSTSIVSPAQASVSSSSSEQLALTASFAAGPQLFTSTATVTTPAVRPVMNARVASFQPSTSFAANATPFLTPSHEPPSREMLMAQMTPAEAARFAQAMSNANA